MIRSGYIPSVHCLHNIQAYVNSMHHFCKLLQQCVIPSLHFVRTRLATASISQADGTMLKYFPVLKAKRTLP